MYSYRLKTRCLLSIDRALTYVSTASTAFRGTTATLIPRHGCMRVKHGSSRQVHLLTGPYHILLIMEIMNLLHSRLQALPVLVIVINGPNGFTIHLRQDEQRLGPMEVVFLKEPSGAYTPPTIRLNSMLLIMIQVSELPKEVLISSDCQTTMRKYRHGGREAQLASCSSVNDYQ